LLQLDHALCAICKNLRVLGGVARHKTKRGRLGRGIHHAILGKCDRSDKSGVALMGELHIPALQFAGMGMQVSPKPTALRIDAPPQLVGFV